MRKIRITYLDIFLNLVDPFQASPRDPENFPFVVLGNKVDLENRAVCFLFYFLRVVVLYKEYCFFFYATKNFKWQLDQLVKY